MMGEVKVNIIRQRDLGEYDRTYRSLYGHRDHCIGGEQFLQCEEEQATAKVGHQRYISSRSILE